MKFLYSYLDQQIDEIKNDRVLRIYGALLSLTIPLTILHWFLYSARTIVTSKKEIICWPFFENCQIFRVFSFQQIEIIFIFLGLISFPLAWIFLHKRYALQAWWFLLALHLVKYFIILLDYRLRLNQHIMAFWIVLLFLFVSRKRIGIALMLIAFYFWAGILKLYPDWLTGATLYSKPWLLDGIWLEVACWYVVILETILIWGLLSSRTIVRYATLFQLVLFHIFSAKIVGFFYPILMLLLLSVFFITWYLDPKYNFSSKTLVKQALIVPLIVFSFMQVSSKLYPGDTSKTGEGRVFALHMFDALNTCNAHAKIKYEDETWDKVDLYKALPPRIHCDPNVYLHRARILCREYKTHKKFVDLDLYLEVKGSRDNYQPLVDQKDFCRSNIHYTVWKTNDWIIKH